MGLKGLSPCIIIKMLNKDFQKAKEENNDDHENHEDKEKEVASTIDMIIE